jgi:fructose/tagatose bisphosphate aldolase
MFDGSRMPLEANIHTTKTIVERARLRQVSVEGELGVIGARGATEAGAALDARPTPEATADFVRRTGIDVVAPALGTIHGMPDDSVTLDLEHLAAVGRTCGAPIALHGASGLDLETIRAAIAVGVAKVNISSRITRALALGIRSYWETAPDELDLRRFLAAGRDGVRRVAARYFEVTGAAGRASRTVATLSPEQPLAGGHGDRPAWEPE